MMEFKEFTEEIKCMMTEHIQSYLPEDFSEAKIDIVVTLKNNDLNLTGINIVKKDYNCGPVIYLEDFYEKYCHGEKDMEEILKDISKLVIEHDVNVNISSSDILEFENVKDLILPRVVNFEWNSEKLAEVPHKKISDLAVTYHIVIEQISSGIASTPVKNAYMSEWGVDVDILHEIAVKNMKERYPSTFMSMKHMLSNPFCDVADKIKSDGFDEEDIMYVLSNSVHVNGASAILDEEIMRRIVAKLGDDFIIVPSSIHEMIFVKLDDDVDPETLSQSIKYVNNADVSQDEKLSDHYYRYSVSEGLIV